MLSVSDVMQSVYMDPRTDVAGEKEAGAQLRAFATLSRAADQLLAQRPLNEVLELVVNLVFEIASPDRGAVMLLEGDPPRLRAGASRGLEDGQGKLAISRTIADAVLRKQQAVMTSDALSDARFGEAESIILQNVRSVMCVPLWNNKKVTGLVYVDTLGGPQRFSRLDLEALTLVANVAAVKIDNVRLFAKEQRMKEMERELQAAAKIQRRLLPTEPPDVPGYEILGYNNPCFEVGGDYYDYTLRNENTLSIAVGDVSGKGMSAALLMASLQASLHAHISAPTEAPDIVSQLNRVVCKNSEADRFSTFFYGEVDVATGALRYCNAGHLPPLIVRAATGEVEPLAVGGLILGFDPDIRYEAREARLEPGDLLVAYSDGVTESMNPSGEEFGEKRLIEMIRSSRGESVEAARRRIDGAVDAFVGQADPFDDYTVLLVRRAAG
jgi:serine phosphatase RsbU (regulator of sigma subunit)